MQITPTIKITKMTSKRRKTHIYDEDEDDSKNVDNPK